MDRKPLGRSFYAGEDVITIAKSLLGKKLCSDIGGIFTSGYIVETEAYIAPDDKASHAYKNKRTPRTETMYARGGTAYVYIIYGMYHLFNVITGPKDLPHCILVRAIEPLDGIKKMLKRRKFDKLSNGLTNGPGKFSIAMGIHKRFDRNDLTNASDLWIEEGLSEFSDKQILKGPRVGMSTAEEASNYPYRFRIAGNEWTSRPNNVWYKDW